MNFYDSWWWLVEHPAFMSDPDGLHGDFATSLNIYVVKVNPKTGIISLDRKKNTRVEVWLECGRWLTKEQLEEHMAGAKYPDDFPGQHSHDVDLDCGGATFEEAIIQLAKLVKAKYGDY